MTTNINRRPRTQGIPRPAPSAAAHPSRAAGVGALVATAAFLFGIGLFVTQLAEYTATDASPASSVAFLVDNQATLFIWNVVIYLVFGAALVPLVGALRQLLRVHRPELADTAAVFGYVWVGLMFATGMVATIGITAVADLAGDATQAQALWSAVDTVTNGLGGGNELVGGAWILLVSVAGLRSSVLPRGLHVLGSVTALAGIVTIVPALEDVGMVFGLGCIAWFAWVGVELLRSSAKRSTRQHPARDTAVDAYGVGVGPA